jgi:hypothetical protein
LPENRRKAMASDLQVAIARFVQDNYADSNAFGDLISPRAPSVVSSRIMQVKGREENAKTVALPKKGQNPEVYGILFGLKEDAHEREAPAWWVLLNCSQVVSRFSKRQERLQKQRENPCQLLNLRE